MADLFDDLKRADAITTDEVENGDETVIEEVTEKAFSKTSIIVCVASAIVALVLGLVLGNIMGGGSQEETKPREVLSVTAHVPAYEQLETMRENTISSLSKQLAEYANASTNQYGEAKLPSRLLAISKANEDVTAAIEPFFNLLLGQEDTNDTIAMYIANHKAFKGDDANRLSSLVLNMDAYLAKDSAGNTIARFVGDNPATQLDIGVRKVSRPMVSIVASAGEDAEHRTIYLAFVPIASERGELFNALYVIGVNASGKVSYCSYIGLLEADDETAMSKAVTDAATLVLENKTDIETTGSTTSEGSTSESTGEATQAEGASAENQGAPEGSSETQTEDSAN